jgi:hypothetical protein
MKETFNLYKYITTDLGINNSNIDYLKCPEKVTYEMLEKEFNGSLDFEFAINSFEPKNNTLKRNYAWYSYSRLMFPSVPITNSLNFKKYREDENVNSRNQLLDSSSSTNMNGGRRRGVHSSKNTQKNYIKKSTNKSTKKLSKKSTKKIYKKKQKGGLIIPMNTLFMLENYPRLGYSHFTNIPGTSMHLMQIPDTNNRGNLFQMFAYLMYTHQIQIVYDLHSCGTGLHPRQQFINQGSFEQCSDDPLDRNCERETWEFLKKIDFANRNNPDIRFVDQYGIEDMTAGTIAAFNGLIRHPFAITDPAHPFVIHCQAGYGRSGSICLLLLMKTYLDPQNLQRPFFGLANSSQMYADIGSRLNDPSLSLVKNELFKINTIRSARLFVSRINLMLVAMISLNNLWNTPIYMYPLPDPLMPVPTINNIFIPLVGTIGNMVDDNMLIANNLLHN